jgi:hypothetical protein
MKISHIINPFLCTHESRNYFIQETTFESLKKAKEFSKNDVEILQYVTAYQEDLKIIPDYFLRADLLQKSILDYGNFKVIRKLPLLGEILKNLFDASDADFLIYSNVDIAVMPYFYAAVKKNIEAGRDSFVINRRTISNSYNHISQLPLMNAELGIPHPGYDCFVFKREMFSQFQLNNICIGVPYVGLALYANLVTFSKKFNEIADSHLTFHLGDDRQWLDKKYEDYTRFNCQENEKVMNYLREYADIDEIRKNAFKYGNNKTPVDSLTNPV